MDNFKVQDCVAIVTGSAQGFGKEFALRLLECGARVCICDVMEQLGQETLQECLDKFGQNRVTFIRCDVTKKQDWIETWDHAEKTLGGKVNLLVNNAGINPQQGWELCLDIMLKGVATGSFLAVDRMGTSNGGQGGRIVNIASMAGLLVGLGKIEDAGYTMAKWGVVALTRSFAEGRRKNPWNVYGIKAYALCPWFADTRLVREAGDVKKLEKVTKTRILTVKEVGDALLQSLELDKNGACYAVFPDCPLVDFPCVNYALLYALVTFGKVFGNLFKWKNVTIIHFFSVLFLIFIFVMIGTTFLLL